MKKIFRSIIIIMVISVVGYYIYSFKNENKIIQEEKTFKEINIELFSNYYDKAIKIMSDMTIEEKVGQLFLVRYYDKVNEQISLYHPGGYILFARDFQNEDKNSITEKLKSNQLNSKIPLILGVDEEGGIVTRVSRFTNFRSERFKSPHDVYDEGGYELLKKIEYEKADLLKSLGINLNLAPVADVSTNPEDFMYDRSFGKNAGSTATYIGKMVNYAKDKKISSSLKHFPGYGNNEDTHEGIAIDNRSLQDLEQNDLLPFKKGIKEGAPTILVSHNIVNCIDSEYPSSLSKKVNQLLRKKLKFSGVIITDDLDMNALNSYTTTKEAATLAINAGNDMIITSNFEDMRNEILENIKENKIKQKTIDMAVKRIISWKLTYDLFK